MKEYQFIQAHKTTFQHIYYTNGFAITKALIDGDKDYNPESTHACFKSGYWCELQLKEEGLKGVRVFLKSKGIKNPVTVIKAIRRVSN